MDNPILQMLGELRQDLREHREDDKQAHAELMSQLEELKIAKWKANGAIWIVSAFISVMITILFK